MTRVMMITTLLLCVAACKRAQPPPTAPAAPSAPTAKIIRPGVVINMPGTNVINPKAAICPALCFYLSNAQSVQLAGKLETENQADNDTRMGEALMGAYTMANACAAECAADAREKGCASLDETYTVCMHGTLEDKTNLEGTVCALSTLEQASQCCTDGSLVGGICQIAHVRSYQEFKKALPRLGEFVRLGKTTPI